MCEKVGDLMERKEELIKMFCNLGDCVKTLIDPILDEVVFLEKQLMELKKLPLISINPKNSFQQRITAAGKQYKEYMQSYTNVIKSLCSLLNGQGDDDTDPVAEFMKRLSSDDG